MLGRLCLRHDLRRPLAAALRQHEVSYSSASARRLRSLALKPDCQAQGARSLGRVRRLSLTHDISARSVATQGGGNHEPRSSSPSSSSPSNSRGHASTADGMVTNYAQKGRKVVQKAALRTVDASKRFVNKLKVLSLAFVKDPRIVVEWYEDIRDAVKHFVKWVATGFRLFGADLRASFYLTKKVIKGYQLSVRERKLLVRTTSDCLKLIPFSFFIIVPFAEVLLPFFLRLFPNMLPSTFFEQKYDNTTLARKYKAKKELAEFWQQVMIKRTQEISESDKYADKAEELKEFQEKLMEGKEFPSLKEILRFSSVFDNEMTLKNMSTKQLTALSKMLGLPTSASWWQGHLEVQLRHHITNLRREDRDLFWEGIDGLKGPELINHCRRRAIRFHGVPEEVMRQHLRRWLELSANQKKIPTSALLWIQSFYLREEIDVESAEELQLEVKPKQVEENPEEAFLQMAERQKDAVEKATSKLQELQQEIEQVINAPAKKQDVKATATVSDSEVISEATPEEAATNDSEEDDEGYVCPEDERRQMLQYIKKKDEDLALYKKVVHEQKCLLDEQLRFLLAMRDNKPTCQKDADVILLDQRVRLIEMIGSFEKNEEVIESLFETQDKEDADGPFPQDEAKLRAEGKRWKRQSATDTWGDWAAVAAEGNMEVAVAGKEASQPTA